MAISENQLRDQLAQRLDLIEPGLTLIRANYPLPNSEGTRGFIDILACDSDGVFVVIELKRSNSTAREALHEIVKYVELLAREKGISRADTRAIIVSTEWAELLVPFSRFKRGWDCEVRGYLLRLDEAVLALDSVEEISGLQEGSERGLTPIHLIISPDQNTGIDKAWREVTSLLIQVGADDVLGIELHHEKARALLYIVVGRMPSDDPRAERLDAYRDDLPDDNDEVPSEYVMEYSALSYVAERLDLDHYALGPAYPDKFEALTDSGGWQAVRVLRNGIFDQQQELYPIEALLGQIVDRLGFSQIRYGGSARPANRKHWVQFRQRVEGCMAGTGQWHEILKAWLDERESHDNLRVVAQIYNPCDFLGSLVFGWPRELRFLIPNVTVAVDASGTDGRILSGVLVWTGRTPRSVMGVVRAIYPDPADWGIARATGTVWTDDLQLIERLGLRYALFEFHQGDEPGLELRVEDGTLVRQRGQQDNGGQQQWAEAKPLPEFLVEFADQIKELVEEYRSHMRVDWTAGSVLVANRPFAPDIQPDAENYR